MIRSNEFEFKGHKFSYVMENSDLSSVTEMEIRGLNQEAENALKNDDAFHEEVFQYALNNMAK